MGFVLERKGEMTLQSSNLYDTNGNNHAGHSTRHERSNEKCSTPDRNELEAMLSNLMANPETSNETLGETFNPDAEDCQTLRGEDIWYGKAVNERASCPWTMKATFNETR